jgi:hypothetical protein
MPRTAKEPKHYVDNIAFADALVEHKTKVIDWKAKVLNLIILFKEQLTSTTTLLELYYLRCTYEYLIANILDKPLVSNYLLIQIEKIAYRFAQGGSFVNYTYKQDMINNAIENCLKCITNFDPNISINPFSYFTQICYFAFIRTIAIEKKQQEIKTKIIDCAEFSYFFDSGGLEDYERQALKDQIELKFRNLDII